MTGHIKKRGSKWYFKLDTERDPITGKRRTKWFSGFASKESRRIGTGEADS